MSDVMDAARPAPARVRPTWGVLAAVTGALFLEGIDIAMLNVAVPSIAADIGLATDSAHWVISAYVLAYGGFMVLGGRVGDLLGRRRVFLAALAVFVVFSAVGGVAQEAWLLLLVRFVTGATAGFMTPAGFSLLTTSFPEGAQRNRALAIYGAVGASGFYLGVVAGGVLTTVGWRWVFFAPVVLGSAILALGSRFLPRDDTARTSIDLRRFDVGGALTLTTAMMALVYGVVTVGAGNVPGGVTALVIAAALLVAFVAIERRAVDPLIPTGVLRQGLLPWVTVVGTLFIGAFFAWQFLLTLYLQEHLGWGPLPTGLTFAAMSLELVIAPVLTPRLVERFGNVAVMMAGLVAALLAVVLTLRLDESAPFWGLLPALFLVGVAFAFVYGPLTAAAIEGVDESAHGVAGGVVYTGFQLGAALGVSIATVVLVGDHDRVSIVADYERALLVPVVAAALAGLLGLATLARHRVMAAQLAG